MSVLGTVGSGLWGATKFGGKSALGLTSNVLAAGSDTYKSAQPTLSKIGNTVINLFRFFKKSDEEEPERKSGGGSSGRGLVPLLTKINENTKNTFTAVEDMAFTINDNISETIEKSYNVLQLHTKLLEKIAGGGDEKEKGSGLKKMLMVAAVAAFGFISSKIKGLQEIFSTMFGSIGKRITELKEAFKKIKFKEIFTKGIEDIKKKWIEFDLSGKFSKTWDSIKTKFSKMSDDIGKTIRGIIPGIVNWLRDRLPGPLKNALPKIAGAAEAAATRGAAAGPGGVATAVGTTVDWEAGQAVGEQFSTVEINGKPIGEHLTDKLESLDKTTGGGLKKLNETMEDIPEKISNILKAAFNLASGTYKNMTASPETISKNSSFIESLRDKDPYMYGLAMKESSGGKNLFATTSSAAGAWQFTEGTWQDTVKKMGKDYTLEDRLDPEKAYEVAKFFDQQNRQGLQKSLGRKVSSKDAYMAHFLGQAGAQQFLSKYDPSNPNQTGVELAGNTAAEANRDIFYYESGKPKSSKQVYDSLTRNFSGAPEDTIGSSMLASNNVTRTEKLAKNNIEARQSQQAVPQVAVVQQPVPVQTGGGGGSSTNTTVNNYGAGAEDPVIRRLMSEMALARYGIAGAGFA